jgi:hypothetical protein
MKWALLPTNIFWIVGHIVVLAVGIFFTAVAGQSLHKDVLLGVGGSLIAAGIAGEILFLYVASSQQTKDKLDLLSIAGLQRIFPTRSVSIRDEYHSRLRSAKEVDILGFGLSSFREDYGSKFAELSLKTSFRILLLETVGKIANTAVINSRAISNGGACGRLSLPNGKRRSSSGTNRRRRGAGCWTS